MNARPSTGSAVDRSSLPRQRCNRHISSDSLTCHRTSAAERGVRGGTAGMPTQQAGGTSSIEWRISKTHRICRAVIIG